MAKPRVFLSSTYYDLKHVRERIERFLTNFGMEPVLFESDNVTFEPNKPLDISCYNEVKLCHMMILIVGGRYGSAATGQIADKEQKEQRKLYEKYVSITRKEYETAVLLGIPIFVFIDKNVLAGHQTYKKNKSFFESATNFNFAHVDDINIFRFISSLENTIAIKAFDKVEEIENYLENQISGMLFLYLQELQVKKKNNDTLDSIAELKNISQRMNEMVSAIGKNLLINSDEYEKVIRNQDIMLITFFKDMFYDNIQFKLDFSCTDENCEKIIDIFFDTLFTKETIKYLKEKKIDILSYHKCLNEFRIQIAKKISLLNCGVEIESANFSRIMSNYINKIYPIIEKKPEMMDKMKELFYKDSYVQISDLPF